MAKAARGRKRSRTTAARGVPRKEAERERRQHMKALCNKLASLIPKEHFSTDTMTQLGSLDEAASYIKKLKDRIDELHRRRSSAQAVATTLRGARGVSTPITTTSGSTGSLEGEKAWEISVPMVEVRQHVDSSMDVVLICSTGRPVKLHEVITILEEEGAEIVNANHSVAGHKIFYTIHSQDAMTQLGSLDEAASYIKKLKDRIDELQHRRSSAQAMAAARGASGASTPTTTLTTRGGTGSPEGEKQWEVFEPVVEVQQHDDTSMDVVLVCSAERPIMLHVVITIIEEEGAEVVNANQSVAGHKIFYTIHSRAFSSRIGIDVSRVSERLRAFV